MDLTAIAASASAQATSNLQVQVGNAVLKKAMDMQAASAAQLLEALPQQPALASSGSVGTQVNTFA